jgi:hypothetical protein
MRRVGRGGCRAIFPRILQAAPKPGAHRPQAGLTSLLQRCTGPRRFTGETVCGLNDDGLGAVRLQHGGKAGPGIDRVRALHSLIVIRASQLNARPLGEGLNGLELPLPAVLLLADICG